jgi:hypothetical protein
MTTKIFLTPHSHVNRLDLIRLNFVLSSTSRSCVPLMNVQRRTIPTALQRFIQRECQCEHLAEVYTRLPSPLSLSLCSQSSTVASP